MKRALIVVSAIVLVTAVCLGCWLLVGGGDHVPSAQTSAAARAALSAREGTAAAAALMKLTSDPASLVPDDQKESVSVAEAVPKGSTIHVQTTSWAMASRVSGTLVATLSSPGQSAATYLVSMMQEHGRWVVVGTMPVEQ